MLILGIDPGTATTGYGIIKAESKIFEIIDFGLIETEKNGDPGKRLINIHNQMKRILIDFNPDVVAIERLFFATNAKTAKKRTHFDNAADALAVALTHALRINEKVGDH